MDIPAIVELAARRPAGIMTNRELNRVGASSHTITQLVRAGSLERVQLGLYRLGGAPGHPRLDLHIAQAYLERRQGNCTSHLRDDRPGFALSGGAALQAFGVQDVHAPTVVALIDQSRRVRLGDAPFEVVRADLSSVGWERQRGLTLAEPARCAGDHSAGDVPDERVRAVVDRLRWRGELEIVQAGRDWAGWQGTGFRRLRSMLLAGVFEQESEGERRLFNGVLRGRVLLPDCQVWLSPSIRVDMGYLDCGLVLEYYGKDAHAGRVDEDAVRIFQIRQLDAEVLVVTTSMLADPDGLAAHVGQTRSRLLEAIDRGVRPPPPRPLDRPRLTPFRTLG